MNEFTDFLFEAAPWLRPLLAWSIALLLVVVILTVPAYFILWPFFERAKMQLSAFIRNLSERQKASRLYRANRSNSAADEFLKDGGLWRLKFEAEAHWSALSGSLVTVLRALRKPVSNAANSLDNLHQSIPALQEDLRRSQVAQLQPLPPLPGSSELVESAGSLRVAWLKLILAGTVLFGLMLVNTGMLSQILRDLGVVPAAMTFAGVPLAYVFAFILTLVEAGLGVAHGATRTSDQERLSIWPAVMIVFAVVVAGVEGFFYSRVAPSAETFSLPLLNYEMPQRDLFFSWGFVLVMTLFSLGSIGFEACATVLRGSRSRLLRQEIGQLQGRHERYVRAVKQAQGALVQAKRTMDEVSELLQGPVADGESVYQELNRVCKQIEGLNDAPPEWARAKEIELTRTEVHQLAQTGGLWLILALLSVVAMTITGLYSFGAFFPDLQPLMLWVLAFSQAVVFLGVGFLLGVGETVVGGTDTARAVWVAPRLSRWAACVIGGVLVVVYIMLFLAVAWPTRFLWFLYLVVGLFLIAAGHQLKPLLYVVRLWLSRLWNAVVLVLEALWLALMRLFQVVIVILENFAYLLATPLDKVLHRRRVKTEISGAPGPVMRGNAPGVRGQSSSD